MHRLDEVLEFWLETCSPKDWYATDPELDARITQQFEGLWELARDGALTEWSTTPRGTLAYLILTDQFPRNMFRGSAKAFATDGRARAMTKRAIASGFDLRIPEPERQFFYLPLEHSECLSDQDRAVRLVSMRLESGETLLHAKAHRAVIRSFGRFPFRNAALGRTDTAEESAFAEAGGYGAFVRALSAPAA